MNDLFNFITFKTEFVDWKGTRVNPLFSEQLRIL